jgi:hypothetical protein
MTELFLTVFLASYDGRWQGSFVNRHQPNDTMNAPYIAEAGYSYDTNEAGKARIQVRNIRGNIEVLSGWFKNAERAAAELRRRQVEFGTAYGCR